MMAAAVFWVSLALLLYAFAGYPLLLHLAGSVFPRRWKPDDAFLPTVSVLLSVYNEERVIEAKIRNFLALDYPSGRIELIVVSDCCSDGTDGIVRSFSDSRIRLVMQKERSGKTRNLNRAAIEAKGEIFVFTDSNSMLEDDAVRKLVRHFGDASIGLVSGKSVYLDEWGRPNSGGIYRRYEDLVKEKESVAGSIVGADGAIYALRKGLYEELEPRYINDFVHTIQVVLKGSRAIFEPLAICREAMDGSGKSEMSRQTRIMAQSWIIFFSQIGKLALKGRVGYAGRLVSHKAARWVVLPVLFSLYLSSLALSGSGVFYAAAFAALTLFFVVAAAGGRLRGVLRIPYSFVMVHSAALVGFYKYLFSETYVTWNPRND